MCALTDLVEVPDPDRDLAVVPDDVLERMPEVGGLVMVNFFTCYLSDDCRDRDVTVLDVVKHINHIRSGQRNKMQNEISFES